MFNFKQLFEILFIKNRLPAFKTIDYDQSENYGSMWCENSNYVCKTDNNVYFYLLENEYNHWFNKRAMSYILNVVDEFKEMMQTSEGFYDPPIVLTYQPSTKALGGSNGKAIALNIFQLLSFTKNVFHTDYMSVPVNDARTGILFTLFHEYKHICQMKEGMFEFEDDYFIWKENSDKKTSVPASLVAFFTNYDPKSYFELPWEIDANRYAYNKLIENGVIDA